MWMTFIGVICGFAAIIFFLLLLAARGRDDDEILLGVLFWLMVAGTFVAFSQPHTKAIVGMMF